MLESDKFIFFFFILPAPNLLTFCQPEACLSGFMLLINAVTGNHFEWSIPGPCFVDNPSTLPDDVS